MNKLLPYLLLFIAIIGSIIFYPIDFVIVWLFMWLYVYDEPSALWAAFLSGLLLDLFSFTRLGLHSLLLVGICFLFLALLRLRVTKSPGLYIASLAGVLWLNALVMQYIASGSVHFTFPLLRIMIDLVFTFAAYLMFGYFFGPKEREPLRLKVDR